MTVADYIVEQLIRRGVTHAFGVYGAANAHLFDAFNRAKGRITMVPTAGEQGASFAAEGFAKAKGPFGVCVTTSGPGAQNAITGVANCYYDSVPVLFLCGQVSTTVQRRAYSSLRQRGFQEAPTGPMASPLTKLCAEVTLAAHVPETLDAAIQTMLMGRPGPAVLSIALDVLARPVDAVATSLDGHYGGVADNTPFRADSDAVAQCLKAMGKAERPIILAGGGTRFAANELRRFAESVGVPVARTWNALDIATDDWPLTAGNVGTYGGKGRNFAVQQADYALVLGCRISGRITGGDTASFLRGARAGHGIWHVDADKGLLSGLDVDIPGRHTIHNYARDFLDPAMGAVRRGAGGKRERLDGWRTQVAQWRCAYDPVALQPTDSPYAFIRELSQLAPDNAIAINDCGGNTVIFQQSWESKLGQRIFSSHGNSPMGGAIGYGIGAAIACPDRPVIVVIGDGGFTLGAAELNTLRVQRERLKNLRIFVLNNGILGITRAWQKTNLDGRTYACGPEAETGYEAPDVVEVCRAYGVTASTWDPSEHAVLGPHVIEVPCPGWDTYEPNVRGWGRPIEEMQPSLSESEFLANMRWVAPLDGWKERR